MASKNLKAIGVRGHGELRVAHPDKYMKVIEDGWLGVLNDAGFKTMEHSALGTSVCVGWGNAQGWLVTRNFRDGEFEHADEISGEEFRDRLSTKEPPIPGGRACMSCPNRCKRYGRIEKGKYAGTKGNIEFEGVGAFGSKTGVGNLDAVFHAYMLSNDYGMDCISAGNMIATFMELYEDKKITRKELDGLKLKFGNDEAMIEALHRIANVQGNVGKLGSLGTDRALKALKDHLLRPEGVQGLRVRIRGRQQGVRPPQGSCGFRDAQDAERGREKDVRVSRIDHTHYIRRKGEPDSLPRGTCRRHRFARNLQVHARVLLHPVSHPGAHRGIEGEKRRELDQVPRVALGGNRNGHRLQGPSQDRPQDNQHREGAQHQVRYPKKA
jgi:hypothetical protein